MFKSRSTAVKFYLHLAEVCGGNDKMVDITVAIDKLDKIGIEKVKEELEQRGLNDEQINIIEQYLSIGGSNEEKIGQIKTLLSNETGKQGIEEIEYILNFLPSSVNRQLSTDFTLARGLSYYTGIILEVKAKVCRWEALAVAGVMTI